MQLEVPGSAGTLTSTVDRKLEDGQRVSHSWIVLIVWSLSSSSDTLKICLFCAEPASAASGPAEVGVGPAVW